MGRSFGGGGSETTTPVPADMRQYFTVSSFSVRLHGRGRKPKKPRKHTHMLHGQGRHPDVWHNKGVARGQG